MTDATLVFFSSFYSFSYGLESQFPLSWVSPWSFNSSGSYVFLFFYNFTFILGLLYRCEQFAAVV